MISERLVQMIDPRGFDRVFEEELSQNETYRQTFQRLNSEFEEAFGRNRYANYESYRQARRQRMKA